MNLYGLTDLDVKISQMKLENQKHFLEQNTFLNSQGVVKSFLDVSMSANLSKNYYNEVTNRVNTINNLAIDSGLTPVFLTITLNGCFRDALNGDFTRFTKKDLKYVPYYYKNNNEISKEYFTIKDLIHILNYQFNLFNSRIADKYKGIKKSYIRVFEPHKKDGVPHIHCLLYVPSYTLEYIFKTYKDIFYAPQNLKQTNLTFEQRKNGEINGFQWTLTNPTGYVMKYITKTFINYEETKELDHLSAWYVKYKVRRILTSRTPIPIWVYRKINFINSLRDFCTLNSVKLDSDKCIIEWSFEEDYIFFSIPETHQELIYENGHLLYYKLGKLEAEYNKEKQIKLSNQNIADWKAIRKNFYNIKKEKFINRFNKELSKFLKKNCFFPSDKRTILDMIDYVLVDYYLSYDHTETNVQRLAILENELIKRGFSNITKNDELLDTNDIECLKDYFSNKGLIPLGF